MTDALCGPSNALSTFQKHTQQDRTLQQDRLVSRPGASAGFRSLSQNAGILDPEFEAFQAGISSPAPPPAFFQQSLPALNHTPILSQTPPMPQVSVVPDWAADFQKLHLSTPSPISSQMQQSSSAAPMLATPQPQSAMMNMSPMYNSMSEQQSFGYMGSSYGPSMGIGYMGMQQGKMNAQPMMAQADQAFDSAAFERAFDTAAAEMAQKDSQVDDFMTGAVNTNLRDADVTNIINNKLNLHETQVFLNPSIQEEQKEQLSRDPNNPDALSQTAGQLLNSVSQETSEKFAQSSFLALMRSLRDKEIVVEGENFINSSTRAIANTTGEATEAMEEPADLANAASISGHVHAWGGMDSKDGVVFVPPARPITPEIDPPAPTLAEWKQRLMA